MLCCCLVYSTTILSLSKQPIGCVIFISYIRYYLQTCCSLFDISAFEFQLSVKKLVIVWIDYNDNDGIVITKFWLNSFNETRYSLQWHQIKSSHSAIITAYFIEANACEQIWKHSSAAAAEKKKYYDKEDRTPYSWILEIWVSTRQLPSWLFPRSRWSGIRCSSQWSSLRARIISRSISMHSWPSVIRCFFCDN